MAEEKRPNSGWVKLTVFLAGLFTVLAVFTSWLETQLLDTQQWGETSVQMLQSPAIRAEVASFAVEELYANVDVEAELEKVLPQQFKGLSGIAAGGLRQVADQGAERALALPQVQDAWQRANEAAHQTLVAVLENKSDVVTTGQGQVQLQLRPLIIAIADQIGLGQVARQRIPASVGAVNIVDSQELSTAQTVVSAIKGSALIFSLLALVMVGLAVWLARGYRWLSLLWLAGALILAAALVLIIRSVGGGYVTGALAPPGLDAAVNAAYSIGTDLLKSYAWNVVWGAVFLILLSWLVSPASSAVSARRFLAVPFGRYPGATFGILGLVAFIFLLSGAGSSRELLVRLVIVLLLAAGAFFFRKQLIVEHPDADFSGVEDFASRTREKARGVWERRPREVPGKGYLERRKAERAAAHEAATTAGEAPTEVVEAPAGDETARLDQLEKLGRLKDSGVLTEAEFAEEKTRLLKRDES